VTGAGSAGPGWGNGKAAAVLYAREGAALFIVDANLDAVRETQQIIAAEGGMCTAFVADVSKSEDVRAMVEACVARYGRVDVLHNN
ncbi:SDR family NAD(P)-dependent oxidoreductase, partial [Streptococcus pneumoniae]|uniref:SDR family NAD(P)-dependent oxidoreductase n=1 Tax=Streptococcus pneumoniae TaxID=1313 RepID=UPI0012D83958